MFTTYTQLVAHGIVLSFERYQNYSLRLKTNEKAEGGGVLLNIELMTSNTADGGSVPLRPPSPFGTLGRGFYTARTHCWRPWPLRLHGHNVIIITKTGSDMTKPLKESYLNKWSAFYNSLYPAVRSFCINYGSFSRFLRNAGDSSGSTLCNFKMGNRKMSNYEKSVDNRCRSITFSISSPKANKQGVLYLFCVE